MMNKFLSLIALIIISSPALAGEDYHEMAEQENARISSIEAPYKGIVAAIVNDQDRIITPYQVDAEEAQRKAQMIMEANIQQPGSNSDKKKMSSVLIFISFSMPDSSVAAKLRDAKRIGAGVVIRGLVNNSFKQTMVKMNELIRTSGGDGVVLNPLWFKKFNIKSVPAVVVIPAESQCLTEKRCLDNKDYDVISGDISLEGALTEIANNGNVSNELARKDELILRGGSNA